MALDQPEDDEDVRPGLETKPFLAHLEDLRWTIIRCIGALLFGIVACAFGARFLLAVLYVPYINAGGAVKDLVTRDVIDPFSIHTEVSVFGGLILTLPVLLYYIGQFLLPALTAREKRFLAPVFATGALLFFIGVTFCYTFVLRAALEFFFYYSKTYFGWSTMWTPKALIDFEVQLLLGFGVAFELPLVLFVLNILGIVSSQQLASKRRHAIFIILVAATCVVPSTDPIQLSMLGVPMYLLYEASILAARIMDRRKRKKAEESGE